MDEEEVLQELQDILSEALQKSNPKIFSDPRLVKLSLTAKATFIEAVCIARKHKGWIPSDALEFAREMLGGTDLGVSPEQIRDGIEADLQELWDAGIFQGRRG